jgi:predicted DNA-binding transcriptional regulator YafY
LIEGEDVKTDRLLAIIILLLNRKRVSATQLAEYFEVSPRTIYRDLEAINQAGVPIVAFPGSGGGYAIMDSFKMDRQMLSPYEVRTIITALSGINAAMDDRKVVDTIEKLKVIAAQSGDDYYQEPLTMDFSTWGLRKTEKGYLNLIRKAIAELKVVSFRYTNAKGENQVRRVEPCGLYFKEHAWYMSGYCLTRENYRHFRLSRMRELSVEETTFTPRRVFPGMPAIEDWEDSRPRIRFIIRFSPRARVHVEDYFDAEQIIYEPSGSLRVETTVPEDEWIYGFILSYGEAAEVIEPQRVREIIRDKANRIAMIYGGAK